MRGRELRWDITHKAGEQGELFVKNVRYAFETDTIEVKHDLRARDTGNVYIEYLSLNKKGWEPSGIASTEAVLWAVVFDARVLVVAPTTDIKEVARWAYRTRGPIDMTRSKNPTKGVLVPLKVLLPKLVQEI